MSIALSEAPRLCTVLRPHVLRSSPSSRFPRVGLPFANVMAFRLASPYTSSALGTGSPPDRHSADLTRRTARRLTRASILIAHRPPSFQGLLACDSLDPTHS